MLAKNHEKIADSRGWDDGYVIMLNPPIDWAAFHNKSQHDSSCSGLAFRSGNYRVQLNHRR